MRSIESSGDTCFCYFSFRTRTHAVLLLLVIPENERSGIGISRKKSVLTSIFLGNLKVTFRGERPTVRSERLKGGKRLFTLLKVLKTIEL